MPADPVGRGPVSIAIGVWGSCGSCDSTGPAGASPSVFFGHSGPFGGVHTGGADLPRMAFHTSRSSTTAPPAPRTRIT